MSNHMPEVIEFLSQRRSVPARALTLPVPDMDSLAALLQMAVRVPDHGALAPWRFVVLAKPDLQRVSQIAKTRAIDMGKSDEQIAKAHGQFDRGHLCVAVIASPKYSEKIPQVEQTLSAGAVALSLVNAALAAGWGAQWISGWISHDPLFAQQAFDAQPHEFIAGFIYLGTSSVRPADRPRPDLAGLVTWPQT